MALDRLLLIVSCSQRKRSDLGLLPAIERYDGVYFRLLRKAQREGYWPENLDVLILSAQSQQFPTSGRGIALVRPYLKARRKNETRAPFSAGARWDRRKNSDWIERLRGYQKSEAAKRAVAGWLVVL